MKFVFKGLSFFSTKTKEEKKKLSAPKKDTSYLKASEDLKKSAEELKNATLKLQNSFRQRQEALNKLVLIYNNIGDKNNAKKIASGPTPKIQQKKNPQVKPEQAKVGEGELFEIYREACINFIETDKKYYFKLRNHSDFLSGMYKRHMGNLRYYDHEFKRLKDPDQHCFTEVEAFVANQVIQNVNKIGREKFVREGHQSLYNELCSKLLTKSANQ